MSTSSRRSMCARLLALGVVFGGGALGTAPTPTALAQEKEAPPKVGGAETRPTQPATPTTDVEQGNTSQTDGSDPQDSGNLFRGYPDLSQQTFGSGGAFGDGGSILRNSGSIFDTPHAADIVSPLRLAEKQSPDMFHALQNEVGILMQRTAAGQASPYVRGLTGQQVLYLVDGIRLNNSVFRFGANQYFNTVDPGAVDHLEVLRGTGGVLWGGGAHGGVVNIVTRGPNAYQGSYGQREVHEIYNTADSSSYTRANVEGWAGSGGMFAGASWLNVRNLDTGFDNLPRQPGTNYQQYAADLKYNMLLSDEQMLTVALQHFEQEDLPRSDRFPGFPLDRGAPNSPANALFFDPQQRDLVYLRYQALNVNEWIDALTFTTSYHRQREVQVSGLPNPLRRQETDVDTTGIQLTAVKDLEVLGRVSVGADWYHDDVDSSFGLAATRPIIPDDAWYETFGSYANWEVPVTDTLTASAGVRYELAQLSATAQVGNQLIPVHTAYADWISYAALSQELSDWVRLVASFSEGFRAPNLDDVTANNPNVLQQGQDLPSLGLRPEHSYTYEVGAKTNFDRLRTQTFVFWTDFDDDIVRVSAGANQFNRANHEAFLQGVEFSGEYLLDRGWSLYGNFWYVYGQDETTNTPLAKIPPAQGILGLRWRNAPTRSHFSVYTWMASKQDRLDPVVDATDERIPIGGTPGFTTLNVRFGHAFGSCQQHRFNVSLENLTDAAYLVHGSGVLGTGITARLGYAWVR